MMKYISEEELEYSRIRWHYMQGDLFQLDKHYCTAQLPLLVPNHPLAYKKCTEGVYLMGQYKETRFSLVLPISTDELLESSIFHEINHDFQYSNFSTKIAWDMIERRRDVIHATICSGLTAQQLPEVANKLKKYIAQYGFLSFRIGGPIIGDINRGRIYFPIYPESINNKNSFHLLQTAVERPLTNIYLVGYYNLIDPLDQNQTLALHEIITKYQSATLLESKSKAFWILATNDDLVLSGKLKYIIE